MTDNSIVQLLLKENFRDIYDALEESGGNLYLKNAINKWLLSLFIQGISEMYIHFIWDMFLLEGNIIIFKTMYAMIIILENHIIKCKTFDELNKVFNEVPLQFNKRGKLAYYLISKKFNFNMDMIKKYRKMLTPQIIKEIVNLGFFVKHSEDEEDEENEENEEDEDYKYKKKTICDLDWPFCLKDKKLFEQNYDHIILKELNGPNVIDNYIDNYEEYQKNLKKNNLNKEKDDELQYFKKRKFENLLIERKKHFCNSNKMSIRSSLPPKSFIKFDKIKKNENKARQISVDYYIKDFGYDKNNQRNTTINKIVFDVANDNKSKISFVKENVEKRLLKEY